MQRQSRRPAEHPHPDPAAHTYSVRVLHIQAGVHADQNTNHYTDAITYANPWSRGLVQASDPD